MGRVAWFFFTGSSYRWRFQRARSNEAKSTVICYQNTYALSFTRRRIQRSGEKLTIYPPTSALAVCLVPFFVPISIIARMAIAIGTLTFNRSVPVNAATKDS